LGLIVNDENEIGVGHTQDRATGCVTDRGTKSLRRGDLVRNIFGHSSARIHCRQILAFS
jgi:hypothetical protein